ncbi:MAG: PAC2 family protein [Candidatus Omnitrophica bacterium]|nr:PAC2 family protein [Candidatus Omnitrophota bacterium]MBU4472860.1 PAC2 family protein [Candidatus Omnitrophota bacterium]MCG2706094.1 PAC2 family protein [Candidatus Omnitrophota bacterium]
MEEIKIYKKPRLKNPYLICVWPGMGEVAFKAATYLVDKLKAEEFAQIPPADFFYSTGSVIQEGILNVPNPPFSKFYYWKNPSGKNDLIIFISQAQPDLSKAEDYCSRIIHMAKIFKVKMIINFAAMPQPIDHTQIPNVWFTSTSEKINNLLKKYNFSLLSQGQISGMNGLFLGIAKRQGFEGFCLLGEIPFYTVQIANPKASYIVLDALSRILNIQIDFSSLMEQAHVMENEINKLLDYLKIDSQPSAPISDEEIEKIKKSLSQLTKLPVSVKEKIEELFRHVNGDTSKANELKNELDKWNVYKEYEDRFLDLFKKKEDTGN